MKGAKTKKKIFAIITARGGSRRLPGKNLLPLAGLPLIAHTIKAALECPLIDRCFVTTEDPMIKKVSLRWGAEVIDRPKRLATHLALSEEVIRHALTFLKGKKEYPDYFVLLQPTSPLRNAVHLTRCLKKFLRSKLSCCVSMTEAEHHPHKSLIMEKGNLAPYAYAKNLDMPRQLLPKAFRPNGAIYIMRSDTFLKKNAFFIQPFMPFMMSQRDSVDIDTKLDFKVAEILIKIKAGRDEEE